MNVFIPNKYRVNGVRVATAVENHGLVFQDCKIIYEGLHLEYRDPQTGEIKWALPGEYEGNE